MLCCITFSDTEGEDSYKEKAAELALALNLPLGGSGTFDSRYALHYSKAGLQLLSHPSLKQNPIQVDFSQGKLAHRLLQAEPKQGLAKALGLKKGYLPTVIDATAGLGADSFIMSRLGCTVTLLERSPIVAALLQDGLRRGFENRELNSLIQRMTLHQAQAEDFLAILPTNKLPQVIYLDPMYPYERAQTALNKKEMRVLRELVGGDLDSAKLLEIALEKALKRVVIKRPKKAPLIGSMSPSYIVKGKSTRYDVYLISPI